MIRPTAVFDALAPATAPDEEVERLIASATATLGHEIGRYLSWPEETTELHRGGRGLILLYDDPVIDEVSPVTVETRSAPSEAWEDVDAADYVLEGRQLIHGNGLWPCCQLPRVSSVRVVYTRGYDPGEGPAELMGLVMDMVLAKLRNRGQEGKQSETIGDYSYTRADLTALDQWPMLASRWRRNRL